MTSLAPPRRAVFTSTRAGSDPRDAANWTRRQVAENNLRALLGRAYPRIRGMVREPSWLFFEILLPFLTTAAFVFVYRALQAPEDYIGFVVLGGAMAAFWLNVIWMMAAQLYWEKSQGNLELYFAAPMHLMAVLLGMALGGLVMTTVRATAVLVIGTWLFGVEFRVQDWFLLGAVFVLTMSALYGLGMTLATPVPAVGPRGVPPRQRDDRARLLRVRAQLPGRPAGLPRRHRDRDDPVRRRARRDAPAGVPGPGAHHGHAAAVGGGADPGRR